MIVGADRKEKGKTHHSFSFLLVFLTKYECSICSGIQYFCLLYASIEDSALIILELSIGRLCGLFVSIKQGHQKKLFTLARTFTSDCCLWHQRRSTFTCATPLSMPSRGVMFCWECQPLGWRHSQVELSTIILRKEPSKAKSVPINSCVG